LIGIQGVRVPTGDDLDEYQGVALSESLGDVNVFARVRPEQKSCSSWNYSRRRARSLR
jgi:Ca2+-transporting ATPase